MATFNMFDAFTGELGEKVHDFRSAGDVIKIALTNTAPVASNVNFADIPEITAGNGYTAGGVDLLNDQSATGGVNTITAQNVVFTAAGGTIGPFRYVYTYNDSAPNKPLISWYDHGSEVTLQDTQPFQINFPTGPQTFFTIEEGP